jgi:hypothetical protein
MFTILFPACSGLFCAILGKIVHIKRGKQLLDLHLYNSCVKNMTFDILL